MQSVEEGEVLRPMPSFSKNIWRDQFPPTGDLVFDSFTKEIDPLKEKVKDMLKASTADPIENVKLIDTLLRLGVSYHFENDIQNQLESIFSSLQSVLVAGNDLDLNSTSIVFRVFRQYGFKMSCDVFNKFKDIDGKLKEILIDDAKGMLSLYEASHLRVHGECVLEEALAFTTANLNSSAKKFSPLVAKLITNALDQPLNKSSPRLAARTYISFYEEEESRDEPLLKFAKLDFNQVQILHKQEVSQITRDFYVADDTFDAYGTPQELQRLIDALKIWDISALDELHDYTKVICKTVLVVFDEIAEEARKEGRSYGVPYARDAFIGLVTNYQAEVKWYHDGIEAFEWQRNDPKIMQATNVIGRLMNDIVSHKFEQLREHAPSSVECYMKQHNLSEQLTLKAFEKLLEDAWKDVNEECMRPTCIPRDLLLRHLNFARASYLFYKHGDGYTHPEYVKDDIRALFVDPIPI
ncbi:putative Terpene synthase 21 [Hibiscus syriacus]|uniref:Terpene synthase 21 n=1 Tax=Hibiscus syriacus TaxID=106335 RepID=A0A6A3AJN0_HIBSY|nr:putative Terpene synthase 21 [Hibiscus syriacus]